MINRPYYYRHFLERRPAKENKVKVNDTAEVVQNKNLDKENIPINQIEISPACQADAESQSDKEEVLKDNPPADFHRFEQVAPGVFQFKQNGENPSLIAVQQPQNYTLYHLPCTSLPGTSELAESGFLRVDGIPGPYEHYQTPVYQFT